jgi:hypothetical protein
VESQSRGCRRRDWAVEIYFEMKVVVSSKLRIRNSSTASNSIILQVTAFCGRSVGGRPGPFERRRRGVSGPIRVVFSNLLQNKYLSE